MLSAALYAMPALGKIYYVSPTGSDSNSGTNPNAPWGSVEKVDDTTFQPGDQILFQYGSTWNASLDATSSGTTSQPIAYGAYGNPSLGNPTFVGSDPVQSSAFTQVTGTTYQTTYSTPVNWTYNNNQFMHEAQDALTQAGSSNAYDPTTDLNYVETTAGSFYYNPANQKLYVNTGSSLSGQSIAAGTRQDAIYSYGESNLIFQNLNVSQTADDNAGYGVRFENGSNIQLLNSTISQTGKHGVGVIDVGHFTGTNLVASQSAPDQGFGGASAYVNYADTDPAAPFNSGNTAIWTNISYQNPQGPYPIYISHGGTGGITSLVLNNTVSLGGYGTGIAIYSTGPNETALLNQGQFFDSGPEVDTNNSIINGLSITGADGSVALVGSNDVVQNNTFIGNAPNPWAGHNGSVVDDGTNNTVRFNVFDGIPGTGPAVGIENQNSGTVMVGNIFSPTAGPIVPAWTFFFTASPTLQSNYNLIGPGDSYEMNAVGGNGQVSIAQWQAMGYDLSSALGYPSYTDAPDGIYMLAPNSAGTGLYTAPLDPTLTTANSLLGAPNYNGSYNAGLNPYVWTQMNLLQDGLLLNNGQTNTLTPLGNTLAITSAGSLLSSPSCTLNIVGNVSNAGAVAVLGGYIQQGNFNNSGSVTFAGTQIWTPGSLFNNTAGTANFQTDSGGNVAPEDNLAINVSAGTVTFSSTQHLLSLSVAPGATAQLNNSNSSGPSVLITPALSITGTLDLTADGLVVQGGDLAAITALVKSGYNLGHWNGSGITSTTAASDTTHLTGLGVILNTVDGTNPLYGSGAPLGLFNGADPAPEDVLVRYTYYGDTNLDGIVDGTDYARIDNGFANHLTGWFNGDFNYDGVIDGSDYTLMDNAFNNQSAILDASITAIIANTTVPEPTALVAFSLLALACRRRPAKFRQS